MTIKWYDKNVKNYYDRIVNLDVSSIYSEFLKLLPSNTHILDAGCGIGNFTKIFLEKGYKVTAFDASVEMVRIATKYCGQKVYQLKFQEMDYEDQFDGIFASASLLHVSRFEIQDIFKKFIKAMKKGGIWQLSFKYGSDEKYENGRLFNNYDEKSLKKLIESFPSLEILKMWKSKDLRPERKNQYWISALLKKV